MTDSETLPVPPLRLRRIHLRSVGPDMARFDPLDLDLSTNDTAAARALLSLTNTGGKSTLITLVSGLIVPAARAQVGRKNIGDYVLTGDTSHVVTEWEDSSVGTRTVLGTVMEWKDGRRQPGEKFRSPTGLHRAWYLFRTGPGLPGIDDLPFLIDGKRTTFHRFMSDAGAQFADVTKAQWFDSDKQADWGRALTERTSIDPVLFGYQMRMNDSESGAEALLQSFNSSDNVVRFLIGALNDDQEFTSFLNKLGKYADLAGRRTELETQSAFADVLAPFLDQLAEVAREVERATAEHQRKALSGGSFAASIHNRIDSARDSVAGLKLAAEEAATLFGQANRDQGRISAIRQQLQYDAALWNRRRLADEAEAGRGERDHRRTVATAWEAVERLLQFNDAKETNEAAKAAYNVAQADLSPLRALVDEARAQLAARLDSLVGRAAAEAEAADESAAEAKEDREQAGRAREDAGTRIETCKRDLNAIDEVVDDADRRRGEAEVAELIEPGESGTDCVTRWNKQGEEADRQSAALSRRAEREAAEEAAAADQIEPQTKAVAQAQREADARTERLERFVREFGALSEDETVTALLDGPPRDVAEISRVRGLAEEVAERQYGIADQAQAVADKASEELDYLQRCGTAPAGEDTLQVLAKLHDDGIGATTGLEWINANIVVPEERPGFIANRSDIAAGIVIADPGSFERAVAAVADDGLVTRTPVTLSSFTEHPRETITSASLSHVVIPHRATWDGDWAIRHSQELEQSVKSKSQQAIEARATADAHRNCAATCGAFAERWAGAERDQLAADKEQADSAMTSAQEALHELETSRTTHRLEAEELRRKSTAAAKQATASRHNAERARALAEYLDKAVDAQQRRAEVQLALDNATKSKAKAISDYEDADRRKEAAVQYAAQRRTDSGQFQKDRNELGGIAAGTDTGEPLETLTVRWSERREQLSRREQGSTEAASLRDSERHLSKAKSRWEESSLVVREFAEKLSRTTAGATAESRQAARVKAAEAVQEAGDALSRVNSLIENNESDIVRYKPPSDRKIHFDLNNTPDWKPADPAGIPQLLEHLEQYNVEMIAKRDRLEQAANAAAERHKSTLDEVESLGDTVKLWTATIHPTEQVFDGDKAEARERMLALLREHNAANDHKLAAEARQSQCLARLRSIAVDNRWQHSEDAALIRVRELGEADLIAEAASLAKRLRMLAVSARGDLADLDKHRDVLREGLVSMCKGQLRLLREMERSSKLPRGLDNLSDQPAIKITFDELPEHEVIGRLSDRIDSWAIELANKPDSVKSADTRIRWLTDAVRDTVSNRTRAGHWSIRILKPRIDGEVMYCAPDRIPHEFSGGQVLTLAVLVYCALSGVRSRHRLGGKRPPGALILDNPFGSASQDTLIKLQHRLAAHTGLQLVCATGLNEPAVDSAFSGPGSVIVKLRNDGDMRRNLRFLNLRATIVEGVDVEQELTSGRDTSANRNWVDAIKYEVR